MPTHRLRALILLAALRLVAAPTLHAESAAVAAPTAPVSIVMFTDFECPYSAEMYFTLQKLQAKFPGQFHVMYRNSPLPIHPDAILAHRAALAAQKQGRLDAMAELLYTNQQPQTAATLTSYARQLHLDVSRFQKDLNSAAITAELASDMEESRAFAIEQTPTLMMNGKLIIGYQSLENLAGMVQQTADQKAANAAAIAATSTDNGDAVDPAMLAQMQSSAIASQGAANAPLTIVEFTDFQCPFCRAAVAPMEQFMADRGREVRWIVHAFPLDFHPDSELATEAALAAGDQGKFWQMHDLLFGNQSALKLENLRTYAQQLNLDMHKFDDALSTHRFAGQIAADRALGTRAGVNGTPTFVIGGRLVTGARSLPELNQIADSSAANAAGTPAPLVAALPVLQVAAPDQQVMGPATDVPLTLTWFTDVRSPLAARQADLIRELAKRYDGKVRVLFRAFPLESHEDGRVSSAALLASLKQGKFWPMFDAVAARRDNLDRAKLVSIAEAAGLDQTRFAADLDASAAPVGANVDEAARRGILGAPVLFVNKQRVDGLQSKQFYVTIFDSELQASTSTEASLAP